MFNLIVTVRDPVTGDVKDLKRQFDPTLSAATLSAKWNALGPLVQTMVNDLNTAVAADVNTPPLL